MDSESKQVILEEVKYFPGCTQSMILSRLYQRIGRRNAARYLNRLIEEGDIVQLGKYLPLLGRSVLVLYLKDDVPLQSIVDVDEETQEFYSRRDTRY